MTEEKKDSMTPLKDILRGLLSGSNLKFNPADAEIWEVWDDVVGPAIAEHAQPSNITKKKLRVHVAEPIWLQELEFVADTIREKLNERLGRIAVEKVIFRLGSL
jgi:predicted nucleic acid-binding Zn ribbon protein